jgi:hypothetical protein
MYVLMAGKQIFAFTLSLKLIKNLLLLIFTHSNFYKNLTIKYKD